MAEQPRLDVLGPQRLAQQRVVLQVDLADGQVVRRLPVGEETVELGFGWRGHRMRVKHDAGAHAKVAWGAATLLGEMSTGQLASLITVLLTL